MKPVLKRTHDDHQHNLYAQFLPFDARLCATEVFFRHEQTYIPSQLQNRYARIQGFESQKSLRMMSMYSSLITSFFERFLVFGFFCSDDSGKVTLVPEGVGNLGDTLSWIAEICEDSGEPCWMTISGCGMVGLGTVSE